MSDGHFAAVTFDIRLPRADLIIWVEAPKWLSAWRAVRRTFRSDEAHGMRDRGDVLRFIWAFDRVNRPRIEALRLKTAPEVPVWRLRTLQDVADVLESLPTKGSDRRF